MGLYDQTREEALQTSHVIEELRIQLSAIIMTIELLPSTLVEKRHIPGRVQVLYQREVLGNLEAGNMWLEKMLSACQDNIKEVDFLDGITED